MKSDLVDLEVVFQHQTEKAVCVRETEDSGDIWVPKSLCELVPVEPRRGHACTITASENLLVEKGLL